MVRFPSAAIACGKVIGLGTYSLEGGPFEHIALTPAIAKATTRGPVITSYSIHYTKLYDCLTGIHRCWHRGRRKSRSLARASLRGALRHPLPDRRPRFARLNRNPIGLRVFPGSARRIRRYRVITSYSIHYTKLYDEIKVSVMIDEDETELAVPK